MSRLEAKLAMTDSIGSHVEREKRHYSDEYIGTVGALLPGLIARHSAKSPNRLERVTGIEPALLAWELDCHASVTSPSQVSRHLRLFASTREIPFLAPHWARNGHASDGQVSGFFVPTPSHHADRQRCSMSGLRATARQCLLVSVASARRCYSLRYSVGQP
jgi:hypothetical protein